eukprot:CAMPEP_0197704532 /NCGR_PEP_ID=MMETSP1338-20131121/125986_1 /TAXON_ID=43686 ORGANISM="Pelagodinium beii, Strain RCC1491" /NCGR_SAMPLE_ID=MMETSP1338 /ASSEMBLY_ACC=CAM_ASM_000754 /LENGTH=412 /DNA_ID=CAMNT_0043288435 /DNA_START=66 /DNA_END=1304 /DNA_ORIENTATION=-
MDPQLQAVRLAARERFLARTAAASESSSKESLPEILASMDRQRLDAPISSLLADAPVEPAPKRPRVDPNLVVVPPQLTAEIRRLLAQPATNDLRFLFWNIDGLDEVGGPQALAQRVLAVAKEVASKRPIAVMLQEAIPPALEILSADQVLGTAYDIIVPEDPPAPYFVAILLDKRRLRRIGKPMTTPFRGTQMGRQLLSVAVELMPSGSAPPLLLATAHLESTKDHGSERKRQLAQSLHFLQSSIGKVPAGAPPRSAPVQACIVGGDLNLRDEEVRSVQRDLGDAARGIADVWMFCGSPEGARWTWDTSVNTNIGASFSCKTRFDRVFFLSRGVTDVEGAPGCIAAAKASAKAKVKNKENKAPAAPILSSEGWHPLDLELVGKDKVPDLGRFPSDHWGVMTTWAPGDASKVL